MNRDKVTIQGKVIQLYKITQCVNGNPRYIVHFLSIAPTYDAAAAKIRKIGGRKYRGKLFGGGLVFSSYNVESDLAYAME